MRRLQALLSLAFLVAAALALAVPSLAQERRVALVIGNSSYSHAARLPNAVNDADAMAESLRRLGFAVTAVRNQTASAFRRALIDFSDAARGADVALLFYAGHGLQMGQRDRAENFLVPVDARLADAREVEDEAIALSRILQLMEGARARLVILDACRDNPLLARMAQAGASRSVSRGLAPIDAAGAHGTLVAFSTAPGAVAADGTGQNSPFTAALVRHLATPGLELRGVLTRVRAEVAQATNNAQVPWSNDGLLSELFLAGPGGASAAAPAQLALAPQPAPAAIELAFWQSIQNSGRAADFEEYLRRYPAGSFAGLARNRITALRAPPRPFPVAVGERFQDCADCPEMVVIPAGRFVMGSPASEPGREKDEGPQRDVTLATDLAVGRGPVTVAEFRAFVQATGHQTPGGCWRWNPQQKEVELAAQLDWRNPGFKQEDSHPVVCVSWEDAQAYLRWINQRSGQRYRLLTEAEWEYAARAGTRTRWWWGDNEAAQCRHANGADQRLTQVASAWSRYQTAACNDGFPYTSPITQFAANRFGLHDMGGNVLQWVEDCYVDSYTGAPLDASVAVTGGTCSARVLRGGSWYFDPRFLRAALRGSYSPGYRLDLFGFRVARTPGG
jgi:formylglycine-generating enzyme required for sulfatase activity